MNAKNAESLYPYLVPEAYLDLARDTRESGLSNPLGHDIYVMLVFDIGVAVESAVESDLRSLGLTAGAAHARAVENLEQLTRSQQIDMAQFPSGPLERPFILVGGFWAASALLLPRLHSMAAPAIGSDELLASIPHRDAMLVFTRGDRTYRDAMRELVRENESDSEKPLTFELFALTPDGIEPFAESQ